MGSIRSRTARSAVDRELHGHLGRAARYVRAAMDVCGRASRGKGRDVAAAYREQQRQLKLAEGLLAGIGFVDPEDTDEMRVEARALCSWLDGRERLAGIDRKPRRGQEYQARLQKVLGFLKVVGSPEGEETKTDAPVLPPEVLEPASIYEQTGVIGG